MTGKVKSAGTQLRFISFAVNMVCMWQPLTGKAKAKKDRERLISQAEQRRGVA